MAKRQIRDYVFSPGIAGVGTLKVLDKVDVDQILLITNATKNIFLYNFSDPNLPISTEFTSTTDGSDPDFPYSNTLSNGVTTITFLYDTSSHASTDRIQIFVEAEEQKIRPYDFGTDAIERMRFSEPQSMIDADFEYGIQPTKWQSLDLLRGYPSIYEVPGSDIAVLNIVTDASQSSGGIGPSLITVDTVLDHNLNVGDPVSVKGLDDSVIGFSKAEGSFIIDAVPSGTQFRYYAKAKVGTSPATQLRSTFTVVKEAGFYTGAEIGNSPTITVDSQGASGNFLTRGSTPSGSTRLGVATTSTLPPIGAPLSGIGIESGTQVTAVIDVDSTLNITSSFTAPVSEIVFNDTSTIEVGAALDNGAGTTIYVTNIEGNTVTLSSPYTVSKTGNSFVSQPTSGSALNFGLGSGASFDISRTNGSYSSVIINTQNFYNNITNYTYTGLGINATFNVERNGGGSANYTNVFLGSAGSGYSATETIVILGSELGGVDGVNDLTITISTVGANGDIATFTISGTASSDLSRAGIGYSAGEDLVVYGNALGGTSPINDLTIHIDTVGASGEILTFTATGVAIPSSEIYNGVEGSSTSGTGINSSFQVERIGAGENTAQVDEVEVGGSVEADDVFTITINGTDTHSYTAQSGDTLTTVRNNLILAVNNSSTAVYADTGSTGEILTLTALTAGTAFTCSVLTEDVGGNPADTQTITTQNITPNNQSTTTPAYNVTVGNPGSGYANLDTITILGSVLGGTDGVNDLTITVQTVNASGGITGITISGTPWNGNEDFLNFAANPTAFNATFLPRIINSAYNPLISNAGEGYKVGYQFNIPGVSLGGVSPTNDLTITVENVDDTGAITLISATGTPVSGDSIAFFRAVSLSSPTNNIIGNGGSISYSAIAKILVEFNSNHGLVPGDTILVAITTQGSGHDLASGPFFVDEVPALNQIKYVVRSTGTVSTGLTGRVYPRTDCFYTHRPFDGGVQLGTGSPAHGAQSVRQSKKYIRYQSGKGIMYTTGALFAPSYDLRSVTADGTVVGSIITVVTDDLNHGLQVGAEIQLLGLLTPGYNGHYTVASIVDEITFTVIATEPLALTSAAFGEQPSVALYRWKGATVRAGAFDDQNGIFFQYDGTNLAVGLRSSTFQIAGTVTAQPASNTILGNNTKFTEQLAVGQRLVIRGMSHVITKIDNDTRLFVNPDYRGISPAVNVKAALTKEIIIPQERWNIDKCDGTGKSGYNIEINRMQMIGFQYTWYGAGFIDWMLRGPSGNFIFLHRLKNNNRNNEAFMRSGNLPVRYEVINEGARGRLNAQLSSAETDDLYLQTTGSELFPDSGTLLIDNELIRYTSKQGPVLSGLTRAATFTNFAAGSQRSYLAGPAAVHNVNTGVILLTNTATPQINHWGSAFLTDGGFDEDRGYLFNYQEKEIEITTTKTTLFLIRLSPSVSNAITGDLGERELINRAQLLLKNLEITTQGGSTTQGVIIEGVLNPRNYPTNPNDVTWAGLNTGGAGGQPSFAQIASGGDITFIGGTAPVSASNSDNQNYSSNYVSFNTSDIGGVQIGWSVTGGDLRGGTTVVNIFRRDSSRTWIQLSDRTRAGSAGTTTYTFEPLTGAAIPGEQVFAFTASPGNRDSIDLSELKELTNTPIGGRGTFPNGPDVLAINAYLTSGNPINATLNIRWSEAQA
jgi:hypothetical protein